MIFRVALTSTNGIKNIISNGKNDGKLPAFFHLPAMFSLPSKKDTILAPFIFLSANPLNLVQSTILVFGKGLSNINEFKLMTRF